jgi:hypothetical protein
LKDDAPAADNKSDNNSRPGSKMNEERADVSHQDTLKQNNRETQDFNARSTNYGTFANRSGQVSRERENQAPMWRSNYAQQRERSMDKNYSNYRSSYQRNTSNDMNNRAFDYQARDTN